MILKNEESMKTHEGELTRSAELPVLRLPQRLALRRFSRSRKSATIHATPAIANVSMPSLQFPCVFGSATRMGIHIATPNTMNIKARRREASSDL
jgi:hypothetical protein